MKKLLYEALLTCLMVMVGVSFMQAQRNISGVVSDGNEPLIGASVSVKGTTIGTVTDIDGSFNLTIPDNATELSVDYLGYATSIINILEGDLNNIILSEDGKVLDEVVITGLASTVKRSNLANAVASISAKELTGVTPQSTVDGALYGKFKGADIRANSGAPGGGFSIRLRGVTSVFLNQQPQYIIDGIYIDNSSISLGTDIVTAAAGGGNTATNQDDASNRVADLIPEDIESIEILKGASAAAIYGLGGAGGVVVIKTQSGKYNSKAKVNFSQTIGMSRPTRLLGSREWDAAKVGATFGAADSLEFLNNGLNNYESELFDRTAINTISALNVSGGSDKTKYFIGGTYRVQDGLVENTGYDKASVRANITTKLTDRLEVGLSSSYITAESDRGLFNNSNANTTVGYALAFTRPWENLFSDENGNFPAGGAGSNPLETVSLITNKEEVTRLLGSVNASYRIMQRDNQSLKAGVEVGLDQYTLRTTALFPQTLSYYRDPASLRGVSVAGRAFNTRTNVTGYLVHNYFADNGLSFRSQLGAIQLDRSRDITRIIASGLNGSQTNVDQSENQTVSQDRLSDQIKGAFFQEEINWDDKIIGTLGIRADKSSNNGDPNQIFWNPKASVAVNLHNMIDLGVFSQLKPRIAFGQSARFAGFGDRFNALDPSSVNGNAGLFTNALQGNPDVSPETQSELEFGVDMGFLDNNLLFTATYYVKTIDDLLLRQNVPSSSGFTTRVTNGGELVNNGIELGIQTEILSSENLSWAVGLNWWKNSSEVTRLDIPAFNTGGFAAFLGAGRIEEGSSATQLIGTIDQSRCTSDTDCTNVDPEGDGFMVYGDMEADFNMSWTNSLLYKNFELNWLFHWKKGGDGINLSTLLYDFGQTTWDFDDTGLDPNGELTNGEYRLSTFPVHPGGFIEDASYLRLREVGLYYNIAGEKIPWAQGIRLGVSGRNILNIFDYNSYDPEVSNFGNNVLINSVEVTPYPASMNLNFHLNVTF